MFDRFDAFLARGERALLVVLFAAMAVLAASSVTLRALGAGGLPATEELVRMGVMWLAFVGGSLSTRGRAHIHLDLLERALDVRTKAWFDAMGSILSAAMMAVLCKAAFFYVDAERSFGERSPSLSIPLWLVKAILPVALALVAIRFLAVAGSDLRAIRTGEFAVFARGEEGLARFRDRTDWRIVGGVGVLLLAVSGVAFGVFGAAGALVAVFAAAAWLGLPLFVVLGAVAWTGFTALDTGRFGDEEAVPVVLEMARITESPVLLAIPMFTLAGAVMTEGTIGARLVRVMKAIFSPLPGGLAVAAVVACVFFAALSGSSAVTIIAVGALLAPAIQAQHGERFSVGLLTASGALGILIPPSLPLILYGVLSGADIQHLFLAGLGPTLLTVGLLAVVAAADGVRKATARPAFDGRELGDAIRDGGWALVLPVLLLGAIYGGILTAAEASVFCVLYAVAVERFAHRSITWRRLPGVVADTGVLVGSILVIVVMAMGLTSWLTLRQVPDLATEWVRGAVSSQAAFLLALNGLLLIVGALMDIFSALVVVAPLVVPMAAAYGVDPIHLGIIMVINLEIGFATPPFGINLFIASSFWKKPIGEIFAAAAPFLAVLLVALAAVTWVPALSLLPVKWFG